MRQVLASKHPNPATHAVLCGTRRFCGAWTLSVRASPAVEAPEDEIRRYLAPDRCKIRLGEAHFPSGEPRGKVECKHK
jgi:hypothetical protein